MSIDVCKQVGRLDLDWVNILSLWKDSIELRIIGQIISGLFGINHWFVVFCSILAQELLRIGLVHWVRGAKQIHAFVQEDSLESQRFYWLFLSLDNSTRVGQIEQGNMNAIVEAFAFFLGFLGWLMVGVALPNRYWKVSSVDGNVITTSTIYENLWMSCATDSTGVHNCRDFPSLLALNGMWPTQ